MISEYMGLTTRSGYNKSLAHFRIVTETLNLLQEGVSIADIIEELEKANLVVKEQIRPILHSVLVEKFQFNTISFNLTRHIPDYHKVYDIVSKWNKFDTVIAYNHPQLGISLINPHNVNQWETVGDFSAEELVIVYTRALAEADAEKELQFLAHVKSIFEGTSDSTHEEYHDNTKEYQPFVSQEPEEEPEPDPPTVVAKSESAQPEDEIKKVDTPPPKPEAKKKPKGPKGKRKMTPKYSCQVTNELFHNGNVEAWKNIIESYQTKFENLEVYVFHEGKRVNNLNSLFKWGKVKHGDALLFSVVGDNFKVISKLQRYLFEGASSRYEAFLKKDVNKPLNLF